jgi:ATP phosphoribosyltransferase regulatory subunit
MTMRNWLLPEYIEDVLPAEAARYEQVRRTILDLFRAHGYQLVIPPLLEYLESLTVGAGRDLDLATFKVVDLLSGRLMGVRADITPQAARIDAHLLNRQGVTRLCYAGTVLRTRPDGLSQTRQPLQVGAELFGHAGIESDAEIQQLLVQALRAAGVQSVMVDFSHVGIFRALVRRGGIDKQLEQELLDALQSKDNSALQELVAGLDGEVQRALLALSDLNGGSDVLAEAQRRLPPYTEIKSALQDLRRIAQQLAALDVEFSFDLAELRGYRYHSGLVFAVYVPGQPGPLAQGGRYDEVGAAFGRARPATGFSMDMRSLLATLPPTPAEQPILAPGSDGAELSAAIAALRAAGEIVIVELPGHAAHRAELGCSRGLVNRNGCWEVAPISEYVS